MQNAATDFVRRIDGEIDDYLALPGSVGIGVGIVEAQRHSHILRGKRSQEQEQEPDADSLFEIGSITKVFTTLVLADMHLAGELKLDDRVSSFLPEQARLGGQYGHEVTLRHLATHTAGLPRLPVNLAADKLNSDDPYADFGVADLYAGLPATRVDRPPGARTVYSNLGSALLGHILEKIAGVEYETLVKTRLFEPLEMNDTTISLTEDQQLRLVPGHSQGRQVPNWHFQVIAGAGAFCSSIRDMTRFLKANIDPQTTPLKQTIELAHQAQTRFHWKWYRDLGCVAPITVLFLGTLLYFEAFGLPLWARVAIPVVAPLVLAAIYVSSLIGTTDDMALGWHLEELTGPTDAPVDHWVRWHNGATAGYSSYLAFSRKSRAGVVVLANSDSSPDDVGRAILKQLVEPHSQPAPSES